MARPTTERKLRGWASGTVQEERPWDDEAGAVDGFDPHHGLDHFLADRNIQGDDMIRAKELLAQAIAETSCKTGASAS